MTPEKKVIQSDKWEEDTNQEIEKALISGDLEKAGRLSYNFLLNVYGEHACRNWVLRQFYCQFVLDKSPSLNSRFDKNLRTLLTFQQERALRAKELYISPYLDGEAQRKLDTLFEACQEKLGSAHLSREKFISEIEEALVKKYKI